MLCMCMCVSIACAYAARACACACMSGCACDVRMLLGFVKSQAQSHAHAHTGTMLAHTLAHSLTTRVHLYILAFFLLQSRGLITYGKYFLCSSARVKSYSLCHFGTYSTWRNGRFLEHGGFMLWQHSERENFRHWHHYWQTFLEACSLCGWKRRLDSFRTVLADNNGQKYRLDCVRLVIVKSKDDTFIFSGQLKSASPPALSFVLGFDLFYFIFF